MMSHPIVITSRESAAVNDDLKIRARQVLANVPVTINTSFGDPFQRDQWPDTLEKVRYLTDQGYEGEIEVSTKSILTDEQIDVLSAVNSNIWIMCGVTGLGESKVPLQKRFDNYLRVCEKFPKTVLNIRPLIPGRNDSMEVLTPIIEMAAQGNRYLKHGGYLDPNDPNGKKSNYEELKGQIKALCAELGISDAPRCSSMVAIVTGKIDSTFENSAPSNLDVLDALGFDFELEEGELKLTGFQNSGVVTKGDVSFAKLIALSSHVLDNWTDPHQYMQMKGPDGQMMVCTSSWFHWTREIRCTVNCWYCHVRPGTAIYFESGDSGCSPLDLYEFVFEGKRRRLLPLTPAHA